MHVTDPVCGMQIDSDKAAASEAVQGQAYYFCSELCHSRFQVEPERCAKTQRAGQDHGSHQR